MDRKFVYSAIIFLVFSALPIGGIMLSIALYPDADLTSYMVDNFDYIIISLFAVTVSLMGGVFYFASDQQADTVS